MSDPTMSERLRCGEIVNTGGKLVAMCQECGKIIRLDKPILGSIHLCGSVGFP